MLVLSKRVNLWCPAWPELGRFDLRPQRRGPLTPSLEPRQATQPGARPRPSIDPTTGKLQSCAQRVPEADAGRQGPGTPLGANPVI